MLAKEFHLNGQLVVVATHTENDETEANFPYQVYRKPSVGTLINLIKWCDIFFQPNISLKGIWPLFFYKRLYVVSHQTHNYNSDGSITLAGRIKQFVSRFAVNICCSSYIAQLLPSSTTVIPNCYDVDIFKNLHKVRNKDLIFVGRLVSDKGCDLIIKALADLKNKKIQPNLTIVGLGPEESALKLLVDHYDLKKQVVFAGAKRGLELAGLINEHKIMIVPSIWEEPFGIVALEGLACGCKMIVADVGGLPEAIGKYGELFERQNFYSLAEKIETNLQCSSENNAAEVKEFLTNHSAKQISKIYLSTIKKYFHGLN